jgi:hypothetical protein
MNKNLAAFLWHMMKEQGLPDEFIDDLLNNLCEAMMLAKMHECKWDPATKTLTTAEEESNTEKARHLRGPHGSGMNSGCWPKTSTIRQSTRRRRPYSILMIRAWARPSTTVTVDTATMMMPMYLQGPPPGGPQKDQPRAHLVWLI